MSPHTLSASDRSSERLGERLHGLDALRGGALLLGVVLHASLAYFPFPLWIVPDTAGSPVASGILFVIHLFRMTTFFLLAGLFGHMMLSRKGLGGFIKDRLARIASPLFGLWWVIFPSIVAVMIWMAAINNGGSLPTDAPPPPPLTLQNLPLTHLWFLWMLLILYTGMLILRAPFALLDRNGAWGRIVDRLTGALIGPWSPALIGAPLALAFWFTPNWIAFFGIPTPDYGLVPNFTALTAFGTAFTVGFLLDRRRDLLGRIERLWPMFTVVALGAGAGAMAIAGGPVPVLEPMTDPSTKAFAACVYAFATFASTFAVIALSLRFMSGYSAVRRYLADASYWVYIVHLPLVLVAQVLLLDAPWAWWVKMSVVVASVMAVALISYELLVRHTFIGKGLNGRRIPWRKAPAAAAAVPAE